MSGAASRRKGLAYERQCARDLGTRRVLTETRDGTVGDLEPVGPFGPAQCRCAKQPSVWRAMADAKRAARNDEIPLAFIKRTSSSRDVEDYAVIPRGAFVELFAALDEEEGS